MKQTGIIMSGNHPQLVLDELKTMTRRVMDPQPEVKPNGHWVWKGSLWIFEVEGVKEVLYSNCPYGQVGDRLWVREAFSLDIYHSAGATLYRADGKETYVEYGTDREHRIHWKPSIFMPRWASRITLEITEVRVERVQEITLGDVKAEGITTSEGQNIVYGLFDNFERLWDSLNAKRGWGWEVNPWVWVISFKVAE